MKRVGKLTDGQATILDIDWDEGTLRRFHVVIRPNSGLYRNGKFKFEINILDEYPEIPPAVWCHTDIYHPNIDPTDEYIHEGSTNVCLNLLENGVWNRSYGLEGTLLGLLFLMHNPNLEDPLSPHFEGYDDEESFQENVRKYMAGEEFDNMVFATDFQVIDGVFVEREKVGAPGTENKDAANAAGQVNDAKTGENGVDVAEITNVDSGANDKLVELLTLQKDLIQMRHNDEFKADQMATDVIHELNSVDCEKNIEPLKDVESMAAMTNENTVCDVELGKDNGEVVTDGMSTLEKDGFGNLNDDCEDDDVSDNVGIELVSVDGDCVLLVHYPNNVDVNQTEENNSDTVNAENVQTLELNVDAVNGDDNQTVEQKEGGESNADMQKVVDTNVAELNKSNSNDSSEMNAETDKLCSTFTDMNETFDVRAEEVKINLIPQTSDMSGLTIEKVADFEDNSFSKQAKCACSPWCRFGLAIRKMVHSFFQQKLYKDISI